MKLIHVFITLVSMVNTWFPTTTAQDLPPINEDNLDPDAAHVCISTQSEVYTELISFTEYFTQTTNTWCMHVPPRCTQYRIAARTGYRIENRYRNRLHFFCCIGYKAIVGLSYCIPHCEEDCYIDYYQGYCVTPGNCRCYPGFKGQYCQSGCASHQWGPSCNNMCNCGSFGSCDPQNGNCVCHVGYTGVDCSQPCVNSFGLHCIHACLCQNNSTCDKVNGRCTCQNGWNGPYCKLPCGPTTVTEQGCEQQCPCQNDGVCHNVTNDCICPPGYKGTFCTVMCDAYHWGENCMEQCLCNFGTCNPHTGFCVCDLGYAGIRCEVQCPAGFYGVGCLTQCGCYNGGVCYRENQTQDTLCNCTDTGFQGDLCTTRDCPAGQYLVPDSSPIQCQNCVCAWGTTDSCHPLTGVCTCNIGYQGDECTDECQMPFYGSECAEVCACVHGDCHHVTGDCTACYSGYIGVNCSEECPEGMWGNGCLNECQCVNDAICHKSTGYCECRAGFFGVTCENYCPENKFGLGCQGNCSCVAEQSTCSPYDGQCQCNPGYIGNQCQHTCDPWKYDYNCRKPCYCNVQGSVSCDPASGICHCMAGWSGAMCDIMCSNNNWGVNCLDSCDCNSQGACEANTGECICFDGYQGDNCELDTNGILVTSFHKGSDDDGGTGFGMVHIIVAIVVPCIILLIIIIAIVTYFTRKVRQIKDENLQVLYEANGNGQTTIANGNAGRSIGVVNPTYDAENERNERRYPHLSLRGALPLPNRQSECGPCDDIDAEKLHVSMPGSNRPTSAAYADIDDVDSRYTTLKSVLGYTRASTKEPTGYQNCMGQGQNDTGVDHRSRSSSQSSDGSTNKSYADMQETPTNGVVSQPLYDHEEVSINRLLLDLPDAPSSTASGNIDQNSTEQMRMLPTYDFPKSTCISPNQCSDQDCRQAEGYMNSNIPDLSGNQRDTKKKNDYDVPNALAPADRNIDPIANGYIMPIHDDYITPIHDVTMMDGAKTNTESKA